MPRENLLLHGAMIGVLLTLLGYGLAIRGRKALLRWARFGFHLATACLFAAAALLMHLILIHRFDYEYVFSYSSTDLPLPYLISTFWAGQEGTILLWALYTCLLGLFVMAKAKKYEAEVQLFIGLVLFYLLVLLLAKSPFARLDLSRFPPQSLTLGGWPREGNGLNPLLQNPWMMIHPPVLFLGYSAMVLPFAFAMAGLMRREYDEWTRHATPWVIFAWTALGLGIFLGGYWAYETLGWGGYWAWDPVENASLMPWLMAGGLMHGILLQRSRGSLRRGNFLLATAAFVLVLYGSYLTRSGVLGDFSVHSFVELSAGFNRFLLGFIGVPIGVALVLFGSRVREIRSDPAYQNPTTRSFAFYFAIILFLVATGLVWLGTSAPIYTGLLGNPKGVEPSFYNRVMVPLGILLLLAMALGPLLGWRRTQGEQLGRKVRTPLGLTGGATALTSGWMWLFHRQSFLLSGQATEEVHPFAQGGWLALWVLWLGVAYFALFANGIYLYEILRHPRGRRRFQFASYLAHGGMALFLIGVVISSLYERKARIELPLGQPQQALGFRFLYQGLMERPDGKTEVNILVEDQEHIYKARPLMYLTKQGLMKSPAIRKFPTFDLYLEPDSIAAAEEPGMVELSHNQPVHAGEYTFTFLGFEVPEHQFSMDDFSAGAVLEVKRRDGQVVQTTAWIRYRQGKPEPKPVELFDKALHITLASINADRRTVSLHVHGVGLPQESRPETAVLWVTRKPFINLVWLGWLMVVLGGGLSAARRALELQALERRVSAFPRSVAFALQ